MLVLITYDVSAKTAQGRKRLNKIAKICVSYGQRVQNSVFECDLNMAKFVALRNQLLDVFDEEEDSIRFYNLGNKYKTRIKHYGVKKSYDPEGILML